MSGRSLSMKRTIRLSIYERRRCNFILKIFTVQAMQPSFLLRSVTAALALAVPFGSAQRCSAPDASKISLSGARIQRVTAAAIQNYTGPVSQANIAPFSVSGLSACNITVTYVHPGQGDIINVWILLPTKWNGRFQGVGGGGWTAGDPISLLSAAAQGYAAAATDAGHSYGEPDPSGWAQLSYGVVNYALFNDFAHVAYHDLTVIGKAVTKFHYGKSASYSYWNGCSQGGRQGFMMAQRYPDSYDGILATAPAINWVQQIPTLYWPYLYMSKLGYFPSPCELDGITAAVVKACDKLDGVQDGFVSRLEACTFKASSVVGQTATCPDKSTVVISEKGAKVAEAVWAGPQSTSGRQLWYGLDKSTSLTILAATVCANGNSNCTAASPNAIADPWIKYFVTRTTKLDVKTLTFADFEKIFYQSVNNYDYTIGTSNPDLSRFKASGGKLISWHGLVDQSLHTGNSVDYFKRVEQRDPNVRDFYRLFLAPGVQHCGYANEGLVPFYALDQLVEWVEKGKAPATLRTDGRYVNGTTSNVELCPWPLVASYRKDDPTVASSYVCARK